jgi:hypothetical protein
VATDKKALLEILKDTILEVLEEEIEKKLFEAKKRNKIKETTSSTNEPVITAPQPIFQPGTEGMTTQPSKSVKEVKKSKKRSK